MHYKLYFVLFFSKVILILQKCSFYLLIIKKRIQMKQKVRVCSISMNIILHVKKKDRGCLNFFHDFAEIASQIYAGKMI